MIAIVDYGVGNLFSLASSFSSIGAETLITGDADAIRSADKIILPGVGAFADAVEKLRASGLDKVIIEEVAGGKELMGICLGMQLLFEKSFEYGEHEGLGLLKGQIVAMDGTIPKELKIPHIGWNGLHKINPCRLTDRLNEGDCVYFVHSFHAVGCEESLVATAEYGADITAVVHKGNIFGCQFHPEKSGKVGLSILKAFCGGGEK